MAWAGSHEQRVDGRIIPLRRPDVFVEGRRLGAAGLDLLVVLVAQTWINDVFGVTRVTSGSPFVPVGGGYAFFTSATTVSVPWLILSVVLLYAVPEALFGATWGKLVAGLRVVDVDGLRPTLGAILVRNILRLVDYWPFFYAVGIVAARLSPRRQRLGDRVARTLVVRAESAPLAQRTPREVRRGLLAIGAMLLVFLPICLAFSYYGRPPLVVQGLVNTNELPLYRGIRSYALGPAQWASGRVTYPISFTPLHGRQLCRGTLTLRWKGFFSIGGGWIFDGGESHCR